MQPGTRVGVEGPGWYVGEALAHLSRSTGLPYVIESITDFNGGGIVLYRFVVVLQSIGPDAEKPLDQSSLRIQG